MPVTFQRILAAALLAAIPVEASAQQVCMTYRKQADGNTYRQVDRETTYLFNQLLNRPDPRIRRLLTGTWQAQIPAPGLGMMLYSRSIYDANGLWRYANRTCGGQIAMCTDAQGHGAYVGTLNGNTLSLAFMYSDLQVENACVRSTTQIIDERTLRDSNGTIWRKIG